MVLVFYVWNFTTDFTHLPELPKVSIVAAILAAAVLLVNLVLYSRELKSSFAAALISYYSVLALIIFSLYETSLTSVPYLVLGALIFSFAAVFAWYGAGLVAFISIGYIIWTAYIGNFRLQDFGLVITVSFIPLVIGWLALRQTPNSKEGDKVYHELRNKLSSVSGQSGAIITAISNGILSVDAKNLITLINPAATKIIGWTKEDAVGLDYRTVFKLNDARDQPLAEAQHPIQLAHSTGKEVKTDALYLVTADSGKRIHASITATPLTDGGVIVIFRDVTEERAEEREQAEFISTASHEMRTPVASIEGFLGLAINPATATIDERARGYITKAHEAAQHLGRLFQDLLDVSKTDDGRMQNNPRIVDVVPFIHDIVVGLLPKAEAKSLFINFKPNPDLGTSAQNRQTFGTDLDHDTTRVVNPVFYVNVDNDHLREVADNLIENAIKYTLKGSITIDVNGDDDHVTISIADSGIGIPAEDIQHLFQKFYRVDNSDTREIGGTGLGLYLCRKLTEAMGGKIWVESTYKEGSTFYVQLPRVSSVEAQQMIEQPVASKSTVTIDNIQSRDGDVASTGSESDISYVAPIDVAVPTADPVDPTNTVPQQSQETAVAPTPASQPLQPQIQTAPQQMAVTVPPAPVTRQTLQPVRPVSYQNRVSQVVPQPPLRPTVQPVAQPPRPQPSTPQPPYPGTQPPGTH